MLTNYAEMDLENIGDYIAYVLLNPESAISTVKGIRRQVSELEYFPERNPLDKDPILGKVGIRATYYRNYKIYYIFDDDKSIVYIVRIFHMLEDSRRWLHYMFELEK